MTRTTLSLLMAGAMALAGVAQAETFDTPTQAGEASTMTSGQPNQLTTNSPYSDGITVVDTTVLGAAPLVMTTVVPPYVYVPPRVTASSAHQAAATFNVPSRAGEASTMTGGAPNMVTDNDAMVARTYSLPPPPRGMAPIYEGN
jgi:hypothetical protein